MLSWLGLVKMGCMCGKESVAVASRKFYLRSRLGEGGFSYVDLVEDTRSHKLFALKRITCYSKQDEEIGMKEIEYMRRFKHPNLLPIEESEVVPLRNARSSVTSEVLIVMPFHRRGTLHDVLVRLNDKGESLSEKKVLEYFVGICQGVKELHSHQTHPATHRDIKPHNVLLADDDTPVLMDFGSMGPATVVIKNHSQAQTLQDLAAERCSMPYRAPELFNVETDIVIDDRIDIWSLGCTLYALCYQESPYDEAYQKGGSIALAVLAGNIKFPADTMFSDELKALILGLLVIDRDQRPHIDWALGQTTALLSKAENRV